MNRHQFNQSLYYCLRFARGLMVLGVLLVASKAAVADVLSLSVDKRAELVNNNTTAIVTGEVACSNGEMYNVSAVVAQNKGALLDNAIGSGTQDPIGVFRPCSGLPQRFEVPVPVSIPPNGTFEPGPAEATVSALATGSPTGSDTQRVDTDLDLQ
jgi:hypothetical protein